MLLSLLLEEWYIPLMVVDGIDVEVCNLEEISASGRPGGTPARCLEKEWWW